MDNSTTEDRIKLALDDLESQLVPNYSATAKKWDINRHTLARRYQGKTSSREDSNSKFRQCLTNHQEDILIGHIEWLTDRRLPPTSQMLRNLAEEIIGGPVGKN